MRFGSLKFAKQNYSFLLFISNVFLCPAFTFLLFKLQAQDFTLILQVMLQEFRGASFSLSRKRLFPVSAWIESLLIVSMFLRLIIPSENSFIQTKFLLWKGLSSFPSLSGRGGWWVIPGRKICHFIKRSHVCPKGPQPLLPLKDLRTFSATHILLHMCLNSYTLELSLAPKSIKSCLQCHDIRYKNRTVVY